MCKTVFFLHFALCFCFSTSWSSEERHRFEYQDPKFHSESVCFKRVPVPHFFLKGYTLPGSAFVDPEECSLEDEASNQIRTSLTSQPGGDYRLPDALHPLHYTLKLCPRLREPFDFNGTVEIDLQVQAATSEVTLNMLRLDIHHVEVWHVNNKKTEVNVDLAESNHTKTKQRKNSKYINFQKYDINGKYINIEALPSNNFYESKENENEMKYETITLVKLDDNLQLMTIILEDELKLNNIYKVRIIYSGVASREMHGIFRMSHVDHQDVVRESIVTQFQVNFARRAFPCFDEPVFRSSFSLVICREEAFKALSNMPKIGTVPREGHPGMVWDIFEDTPQMPTYILAFAVLNEYDYLECNSSVPIKIWAPSNMINLTQFGCQVTPPMLDAMSNYFGVPYTLPKMDLVAFPDFPAFGMENWGLILFQVDRLLVDHDPSTASPKAQLDSMLIISHELVHQWFGNLVTPSWWSYIWLNEGFANFFALYGVNQIQPSWEITKDFILTVQHQVLANDGVESTRAMVVQVNKPSELVGIFDEISYGKGCFVVRMITHFLSEETMMAGLRHYLTEMAYKSVTQDDLWHSLTIAGHASGTLEKNMYMKEIMEPWTLQKGYPLVSVTRLENGHLQLTQVRFYGEADEIKKYERPNDSQRPKWWIPISFASKRHPNMSDTSPEHWMNSYTDTLRPGSLLATDDWYLLNIQQTGFYRVNYDDNNWLLLAQQLQENPFVFDDITRAQLVDDSFSLAYSGRLDIGIPLNIISYIGKENSTFPLRAAIDNVRSFLGPIQSQASKLLLDLFSPHYPKTGLVNRPRQLSAFVRDTSNKVIEYICPLHPPCREEARIIFQDWIRDEPVLIDESLIHTVLEVGSNNPRRRNWGRIYQKFAAETDPGRKQRLLEVLGGSDDLRLNAKLLSYLSTTSSLSSDYLLKFMKEMSANPVSTNVSWQFLQQYWPGIVGSKDEQEYFEAVVPQLNTKLQYLQLKNFMNSSMVGSSMHPKYVEEVVRNVRRKIDFQHRNSMARIQSTKGNEIVFR